MKSLQEEVEEERQSFVFLLWRLCELEKKTKKNRKLEVGRGGTLDKNWPLQTWTKPGLLIQDLPNQQKGHIYVKHEL